MPDNNITSFTVGPVTAFGIAKKYGFHGTPQLARLPLEEQAQVTIETWLENLKGDKGDRGERGFTGDPADPIRFNTDTGNLVFFLSDFKEGLNFNTNLNDNVFLEVNIKNFITKKDIIINALKHGKEVYVPVIIADSYYLLEVDFCEENNFSYTIYFKPISINEFLYIPKITINAQDALIKNIYSDDISSGNGDSWDEDDIVLSAATIADNLNDNHFIQKLILTLAYPFAGDAILQVENNLNEVITYEPSLTPTIGARVWEDEIDISNISTLEIKLPDHEINDTSMNNQTLDISYLQFYSFSSWGISAELIKIVTGNNIDMSAIEDLIEAKISELGGGNDSLPAVTNSDNNAMMQVINGAWAKGKKVWVGTTVEYAALNSYDNDTLYFIAEDTNL